MSEADTPPMARLRGITLKSTSDGVPFTMEPAGRGEVRLVPKDPEQVADEPTNKRTLSLKSVKSNLKRGEYYFPDPDEQNQFNAVLDELD